MTVIEIMLWIGVLAGNILRFRFWGYYVGLECYYGRQAMHHTAFIPICHPTLIDPLTFRWFYSEGGRNRDVLRIDNKKNMISETL